MRTICWKPLWNPHREAVGLEHLLLSARAADSVVLAFDEEHGPLRLAFLTVGGRRIAAGVGIHTRDGYLYYNAGVDPDARDLSPGVVLLAKFIERTILEGCRRFDLLRGDEPYKYEWGAVDEPIQRILLRRGS